MHEFLKFISGIKIYMFRTVFHCKHSSGICHTILRAGSGWNWFGSAAAEPNQFHPDPARTLSANLYDIYHCCVYSEKQQNQTSTVLILLASFQRTCVTYHCCVYSAKLLLMERGTVRNL